jgi:putative hydrolase of the HAD superfamily
MIKLIAFDFWGTLAIKRNPFFHFSEEIKKEFEINLSKEKISTLYQETVQVKYWESQADAFTEFARRLKISPTKDNIVKLIGIRNKSENGILVFDFVIPLLKKLREKRYKIAIISNCSMFTYQTIKKETNLLKYIDYEHFSFQAGYTKPNPQIYLELQRKAKVFNNEMIMIGDDFENDFKAPKKLGINAIMFKTYEDLLIEFKKYNIEL